MTPTREKDPEVKSNSAAQTTVLCKLRLRTRVGFDIGRLEERVFVCVCVVPRSEL